MSVDNGHSIASDVLDQVVGILGSTAERCRLDDYAIDELPAENVIPSAETEEHEDADENANVLRFEVVHIVAGGRNAEKLADSRFCRSHALLMKYRTLGGLVRTLRRTGKQWHYDKDGEVKQVSLAVTYEAEFSTSRTDPRVPGL